MRRRSREAALQILYQMDIQKQLEPSSERASSTIDAALRAHWVNFEKQGDRGSGMDRDFVDRLVRGVAQNLDALDQALVRASQNWRLQRMDKVDRNLLRLACYEIVHCLDIPKAVSINEAVEIAKRFCNTESASFINGVLDQVEAGLTEAAGESNP